MWSFKTGGLSWQWSLKTGFTVIPGDVNHVNLRDRVTPDFSSLFTPSQTFLIDSQNLHRERERE